MAVGLAQNAGALRALAAEGIQRGHMSLHARNVAVTAGAQPDEIDEVARQMVTTGRSGPTRPSGSSASCAVAESPPALAERLACLLAAGGRLRRAAP